MQNVCPELLRGQSDCLNTTLHRNKTVCCLENLEQHRLLPSSSSAPTLQAMRYFHTDVVIIGNGPSAIALSTFLSGYQPYYNVDKPHPNEILHKKLISTNGESLLEQDLETLAEGLEGRSNNAVSLLYDSLVRPNADLGDEHPSCLSWQYEPEKRVSHVVLGKGPVGGTWADFSPDIITVSFGSWLDLPAYSFRQWLEKEGANFATELEMTTDATKEIVGRVPCAAVQQYFKDYIVYMGLEKRFVEYVNVTSTHRDQTNSNQQNGPKSPTSALYPWRVYGTHSGGSFCFRAKKVVLATGASVPKFLNVPGESAIGDNPSIYHSMAELEARTARLILQPSRPAPVLVVGDGLSAADAVIRLLVAGLPVVHSFRKTPRDNKHILSKLSRVLYPEYDTVFQLMTSSAHDRLYTVYPCTDVVSFVASGDHQDDGDDATTYRVTLKAINNGRNGAKILDSRKLLDQCVELDVSCAVILIGFEPNLSFLSANGRHLAGNPSKSLDSKSNVVSVDSRCRCINDASLYALGPLIGDNFVRYLVGGSMAAASDLCRELKRV